jgi:alkyl hydroperoxide reductase subunit AhpC
VTHPLVGQPAPDFTLTDHHGRIHTKSDFSGRGLLLVFVPFAFTDVCTNELVDLRDAKDVLDGDVLTAVVSCDSIYTLKAWAEAQRYEGMLLSDFWPHGEASRAFGVFHDDKGLATRGSFLIDGEGIVRWAIKSPQGEARDVDDYRQAIDLLV